MLCDTKPKCSHYSHPIWVKPPISKKSIQIASWLTLIAMLYSNINVTTYSGKLMGQLYFISVEMVERRLRKEQDF